MSRRWRELHWLRRQWRKHKRKQFYYERANCPNLAAEVARAAYNIRREIERLEGES